MTDRPLNTAKAGSRDNRRSGRDRRRTDKGHKSGRDRRVGLEPRQPDVRELEISVEEWHALHALAATHKAAG